MIKILDGFNVKLDSNFLNKLNDFFFSPIIFFISDNDYVLLFIFC